MSTMMRTRRFRSWPALAAGLAMLALGGGAAAAQTYGFATMQPGTLSHTSSAAIAKVLKEKGGLNVLVQPTAGETTLIPMVGRGEADLGIANIFEVDARQGGQSRSAADRLGLSAARHLLGAQGQRP